MTQNENISASLSASVTVRNTPKDCFFTLDCGVNWCPGWAIADTILPLAVHANLYALVWDITGTAYWIPKNRIKYRGECHQFEYDRYQQFNWDKWQEFPALRIEES